MAHWTFELEILQEVSGHPEILMAEGTAPVPAPLLKMAPFLGRFHLLGLLLPPGWLLVELSLPPALLVSPQHLDTNTWVEKMTTVTGQESAAWSPRAGWCVLLLL